MVACMAILILWTGVIAPLIWPPPKPAPRKPAPPPAAAPASKPAPPPAAPTPQEIVRHPELPPVTLRTGRLKAVFTNVGAGLRELAALYENEEVLLLGPRPGGAPHLAVREVGGPDPVETLPWKLEEQTERSVRYSIVLRSGVRLAKKFTLDPEAYRLGFVLDVEGPADGPEDRKVQLELLALQGIQPDSPYRYDYYLHGVVAMDGRILEFDWAGISSGEAKLAEARRQPPGSARDQAVQEARKYFTVTTGRKDWFGLKNRFFAILLQPIGPARTRLEAYEFHTLPSGAPAGPGVPDKNLSAAVRTEPLAVRDRRVSFEFSAYAGPLKRDFLAEVPGALDLINYGAGCTKGCGPVGVLFAPMAALVNLVAPAILGLLKFFGGLFGNYGVGIILTTLVIRVLLFPLSKKSQVSAFRMQQLAPKIQALRERYKDDQQKFGVEQMRLFREHKINPLSGCVPLLLQMPIFVGMYSVFELSVELRREPFVLWIRDLSQPDMLLGPWAPIEIPLLPTIDGLNLLPIVMTVIWFLQAYYAPRSPDPQMAAQQKILLAMPVIFGLMCYGLASGLSLYFLMNSLLAMVEQKVIKKFFLKPPEEGGALERRPHGA
jgi:YidC/Oxa1 family membrane protein insertase